jgi:hypothetical protein
VAEFATGHARKDDQGLATQHLAASIAGPRIRRCWYGLTGPRQRDDHLDKDPHVGPYLNPVYGERRRCAESRTKGSTNLAIAGKNNRRRSAKLADAEQTYFSRPESERQSESSCYMLFTSDSRGRLQTAVLRPQPIQNWQPAIKW